ncbi:MAG: uracil-DNA glycosylase [Chitinophagaceae bacterium]|nr:uracil-DNA glycosylase [Chitinophagaceae bacterium]
MEVTIESSWKSILQPEFDKPYFQELVTFIKSEISNGKTIYPPGKLFFNAFDQTPFDQVKVVLLGQDPYHNPGQAHGLCFSVPNGITPPPSLKNIFKELHDDLGIPIPNHGNLTNWAKQGVLLLNTSLTVRRNEPASHSQIGWQQFTDATIRQISEKKDSVVFILWGAHAKNKRILIDPHKHFILTASHPSPYSASNGFFGCKHFSKTNNWLINHGKTPVDWNL